MHLLSFPTFSICCLLFFLCSFYLFLPSCAIWCENENDCDFPTKKEIVVGKYLKNKWIQIFVSYLWYISTSLAGWLFLFDKIFFLYLGTYMYAVQSWMKTGRSQERIRIPDQSVRFIFFSAWEKKIFCASVFFF